MLLFKSIISVLDVVVTVILVDVGACSSVNGLVAGRLYRVRLWALSGVGSGAYRDSTL